MDDGHSQFKKTQILEKLFGHLIASTANLSILSICSKTWRSTTIDRSLFAYRC